LKINHAITGGGSPPSKYLSLADKNYSILIMTPTMGNCSIDYASSLAQTCVVLQVAGIDVTVGKTMNSCFVHHSRNLNANAFLNSNHSHLLQIDSDMSWQPNVVLDMLLFDKDFISAIGRKKTMDTQFAGVNYTDENGIPIGQTGDKPEDSLVKMAYVGGAFTLQKRRVFEELQKVCEYSAPVGTIFYKDEYTEADWRTEDYTFCIKCKGAGIDVWCYPNVTLGHLGGFDYSGNYFEHLVKLKNADDDRKAVTELRKLTDGLRADPVASRHIGKRAYGLERVHGI